MAEIPTYRPDVRVNPPRTFRRPQGPNVGDALANLGQSVTKLAVTVAEVEQRRAYARDLNQAYAILNDAELGIEEDMIALRREGLDSEAFRTQGQGKIAERQSAATSRLGSLKDERARQYAEGQLGRTVMHRTSHLFGESDQRFVDEDRSATAGQLEGIRRLAIDSPDSMAFAMQRQRGLDLIAGKRGNTMSNQEAEKATVAFEKDILDGWMRTRIRNHPELTEQILTHATGMTEPEKNVLRDYSLSVIRQRVADGNRVKEAVQKEFSGAAERAEVEFYELARTGQTTKEAITNVALRYTGPFGDPLWDRSTVAALHKALDDRGTTASDLPTLQRLGIGLETAKTPGQIDALKTQTNQAYNAGLLRKDDWVQLIGKGREWKNQMVDETKASYRMAHDEVEAGINSAFRVNPFMPLKMFDPRAQAAHVALRELNKVSVYRGGNVDPRQWWEENYPRIIAQVPDILKKVSEQYSAQIPPNYRVRWQNDLPTDEDLRNVLVSLETGRSSGTVRPEEYTRIRRSVYELIQLQGHYKSLPATPRRKSKPTKEED